MKSTSGGELLPESKELITYSRRKVQQKQASSQPPSLNSDPLSDTLSTDKTTGIPPVSEPVYDDLDLPIALRKGKRNTYPISNYLSYDKLSENHKGCLAKLSDVSVPKDINEALGDPNWKKAVMEEINALEKNGTWEVVNLPRNHEIVGCK